MACGTIVVKEKMNTGARVSSGRARRRTPAPSGSSIVARRPSRLDTVSRSTEPNTAVSGEINPRVILDGMAIGIAVTDLEGRIVDSNAALQRMLGYGAAELCGVAFSSLSEPEEADAGPPLHSQLIRGGCDRVAVDRVLVSRDRHTIWCHVTAALIRGNDDRPEAVAITLEDATERRWMADALRENERQLRTVVERVRDGLFIGTPDGLVIMYNPAMEAISGYTMIEANEHGWFDLACRDPAVRATVAALAVRAMDGENVAVEVPIVRKNGSPAWIGLSMSPIRVGRERFFLGVVSDITRGKQQEEQLAYLASHDALTGLPNRLVLEESIRREMARLALQGGRSALLFADVDDFKTVNDTLGHSSGDQVLVTLAHLLRKILRPEDVLARLGGDEFGVLLFNTNPEGALVVAERLRRAVDEFRFSLGNHVFHLGLSIGAVPIQGQPSGEVALSQADAAMYQAKRQGRNRVVLRLPRETEGAVSPREGRAVVLMEPWSRGTLGVDCRAATGPVDGPEGAGGTLPSPDVTLSPRPR